MASNDQQMAEVPSAGPSGGGGNPVVSTLPHKSPHPYSSVTLSPDRCHALVAARDVLRVVSVSPAGLAEERSVRVSQYFAGQAQAAAAQAAAVHGDVRDAFVSPTAAAAAAAAASTSFAAAGAGANVTINDVAWSLPQRDAAGQYYGSDQGGAPIGMASGPGGGGEDVHALSGGAVVAETSQVHHVKTESANPSDTATVSSADPFDTRSYSSHKAQHPPTNEDTLVAAAGSNGVVVVWKAEAALLGKSGAEKGLSSQQSKQHMPFHHRGGDGDGGPAATPASAATIGQPEAILAEHTRAVNRVAFHPTGRRPGLLLTASQDATVKLWERRVTTSVGSQTSQKQPKERQKKSKTKKGWFGMTASSRRQESAASVRSYSWRCIATFQPKAEAVRDIAWHPNNDDVFAMVTDNGTLLVYDIRVTARPWIRFSVHAGEATTVDWHPTRKYYLATGGGRDRSVKIWDLENGLSLTKSEENVETNSSSDTGGLIEDVSRQNSGSTSVRFGALADSTATTRSIGSMGSNVGGLTWGPSMKRSLSTLPLRTKSSPIVKKHTLAISAPVTRLEWRPEQSVRRRSAMSEADYGSVDRHDAMVAVTTAPISGASAGGSGSISLWSWHRPFMPLSIVEGHKDGAVTDFVWLDTPPPTKDANKAEDDALIGREVVEKMSLSSPPRASAHADRLSVSLHNNRHPLFPPEAPQMDSTVDNWIDLSTAGTWQHVLSVGRDGNCLLQSLARGERPISRVPPSTFAIANLSPFQSGFGSLQIFSLHQDVPSGENNDYKLTGLRRDEGTSSAPGVFREDVPVSKSKDVPKEWDPMPGGQREPRQTPELLFSVTDQGDLDEFGAPLDHSKNVAVAPEVQHLSRFADAYCFHTSADYPSKIDLCVHNSMVAEGLQFDSLAHMWRTLASMLEGAGIESLSQVGSSPLPTNPMAFILLPTLHKLLLERADAGDVQSCVAICEVMGVVAPPSGSGQQPKILIPDLSIEVVREWYLSYIDLLQQMCLFSHAAALISTCSDPFVGALNQQSTTIHEACPKCGKPLDGTAASDSAGKGEVGLSTQRICKRCREQVGLCFLCHEVVKGMYVWCPGCGHGGHLQHALEWFGGTDDQPPQELCPVGCGHRCNLLQRLKAFPEDAQMMCVPISGGE